MGLEPRTKTQGVILIGHGSLRSESGIAMQYVARRLHNMGVSSVVEACFLNYSRPTLAEIVRKCRAAGAKEMVIQPYFLVAGVYVRQDLPALVEKVESANPGVRLRVAEAFGWHPALVTLVCKRIEAVVGTRQDRSVRRGLLFMAHGTPMEAANSPLVQIAQQAQADCEMDAGVVGYLDCNEPDILAAAAQLVQEGVEQMIALPCFVQRGRHVREDIPALLQQAQNEYPDVAIIQADYLGYDDLLVDVIRERVAAAARDD